MILIPFLLKTNSTTRSVNGLVSLAVSGSKVIRVETPRYITRNFLLGHCLISSDQDRRHYVVYLDMSHKYRLHPITPNMGTYLRENEETMIEIFKEPVDIHALTRLLLV